MHTVVPSNVHNNASRPQSSPAHVQSSPAAASSVATSVERSPLRSSSQQALLERVHQHRHPGIPLKIIALGDSLVYGFGDPVGGGWVEQLRRQWMHPESPGHVVYNLGIRGDGVAQVHQRLMSEFSCRGELRHRVPDVILLSVGTNDTARLGRPDGKPFTPLDQFGRQLDDLLQQAQSLCPVLFVGMPPVDSRAMPFAGCLYYNHRDQQRYVDVTQALCQAHSVPYLNIFEHWIGRGEEWWSSHLCADGLHPNSLGYAALLEDVMRWDAFAVLH